MDGAFIKKIVFMALDFEKHYYKYLAKEQL